MTDAPKMMFSEEAMASLVEGSDLMAQLVRDSLYHQQEVPPQPIFQWYVENTAYRYVLEEYRSIYSPDENSAETVKALGEELNVLNNLLSKNKQFGLQTKLNTIMKTRLLHLPEGYISAVLKL